MTTGISNRTHVYVSAAEGTFGTPAEVLATSAIRVKSCVFTPERKSELREDYHPTTRDPLENVELQKDFTFATTVYGLGSGTQGTAPDIDDLLKTMLDDSNDVSATTVAASPAPAVDEFKLTADNVAADQIFKIDVKDAAGVVIEQKYLACVSKDGGDVLTVFPPLANAPHGTELAVVKDTNNYETQLTPANTVTMVKSGNMHGEVGVSSRLSKLTYKFTDGEPSEITGEGPCRRIGRVVSTTLNGGINDSVTTVVVHDPGISVDALLLCESELMHVTAVNATGLSLTVTRGFGSSAAAAHSDAVAVTPISYTDTTAGNVIRGLYGGVWIENIGNTADFLCCKEVTVEIDDKAMPKHYIGDEGYAADVNNPANREVKWSITAYMTEEMAEAIKQAITADSTKVMLMAGAWAGSVNSYDTDGRAVCLYSKAVVWNEPAITETAGELLQVTLESKAVLAVSGEDAIRIAY